MSTPRKTAALALLTLLSTVLLLSALAGPSAPRIAAQAAAIDSTLLYTVADATVKSQYPTINFGAEHYLRLAYSSIDVPIEEALILRFDLTRLPAGAIVDSATMHLFLTYAAGAAQQPVVVWYVTSPWSEAAVTWNDFPTVEPQFPRSWSVDSVRGEYKPLDVTAWARYWYAHPAENWGVLLRRPTSDSSYFERVFESKDHNERMPRLLVEYHLPEPPTPTATPVSTLTGTARPTQTPTGGAVATPTGGAVATRTPPPTATLPSSCPDLLVNGDLESGVLMPWQGSGLLNLGPGRESAVGAFMQAQGHASAQLWQGVLLPLAASPATLDFWWLAENSVEQPEDRLIVFAMEEGLATELRVLRAMSPLGQWHHEVIDITQFAGRLREVTFTAYGDPELPTVFRLDDIHLFACGVPVPSPTAQATPTATPTGGAVATPTLTPAATSIVPEVPLPDLVITDIWTEGRGICYQVLNAGAGLAAAGHAGALFVDEVYRGSSPVEVELLPGARWRGCFDQAWECSGREDAVIVEADYRGAVAEGDEANNRRGEDWRCDTVPPVIVGGPRVLEITANSALISWETDEHSDSLVRYGRTARLYTLQVADAALLTQHQLTLTGLEPATAYHFLVQSADAGGNSVAGRDATFVTLPLPDGLDPVLSLQGPGSCRGTVTIAAAATDNAGVERVEFRLYEISALAEHSPAALGRASAITIGLASMFTDYSPPYEFQVDCDKLANGQYSVTAKAVDLSGRSALGELTVDVDKILDLVGPTVNLYHPSDGATVSGDQRILVLITDDVGISNVQFLLGTTILDSYNYATVPSSIEFAVSNPYWWETQYYANGTYTVTVKATDTAGLTGSDWVTVTVSNQASPFRPKLVVTAHEVTRHNNYFGVDLTVTNKGDAAASHIVIEDPLKGFQPLSGWDASHLVYYGTDWNPVTTVGTSIISDTASLGIGQSRYYTFKAVPVMAESNAPKPSIGDSIELYYSGPYGTPYTDTMSYTIQKTTLNYPDVSIPTAHSDALEEANYLLVTNPGRIWMINLLSLLFGYDLAPLQEDANELLATMAHLAYLENGALGYVTSYSASALKGLIQPGGTWASQLSSSFSTSLGGYLLLVGESDFVPAFDIPQAGTGPLHHSDQPYADTTGNDDVPELIVGRIIGDKYKDLTKALKTSIGIREGKAGYGFDHSHALLVAGGCGGENSWQADLDSKVAILDDQFSVSKIQCLDYYDLSSFAASYSTGDGFATGNVTGDSRAEVLVGDIATDNILVYSGAGTKLKEFACGHGTAEFAAGDQLAVANSSIVMADASADRILYYNWAGVLQSSFSVTFDPGDGLATGDVVGDAYEDIVIADASADKVYIYTVNGVKLNEFSCSYGTQDKLSVGETMGLSKAQILHGNAANGYVYVYDSNGNQKASFDAKVAASSTLAVGDLDGYDNAVVMVGRPQTGQVHLFYYWIDAEKKPSAFVAAVHYDVGFGSGDGLAAGDLAGGSAAEVLVADAASASVYVSEPVCASKLVAPFKGQSPNKDVIFFTGHGSPSGWCDTVGTGDLPASFGSTNPFVFGATCSSGNYDGNNDNSIGEAFFDSGASLYLGATVVSLDGWESDWFFKNWVNTSKSVGRVLAETEKATIANHKDYYWVREYNLYGDPKIGGSAAGSGAADPGTQAAAQDPPAFLEVVVPDYQVTTTDGQDYVEIPGGGLLLVEGQPQVPLYTVSLDYPPGVTIQDVRLANRSGLTAATGLNIPPVTRIVRSLREGSGTSGDGWYPAADYEWQAFQNPEGTTTLVITLYPFYCNPLTTDVQFYQSYAFDIVYASSRVEVTALQTNQAVYPQGAPVLVHLALDSAGEPQDVFVNAAIKRYGSHEVVAGMLLSTLYRLAGPASFDLRWDSAGFEPDCYYAEVTLQDGVGTVLDRETAMLTLGVASAEIAHLSATPAHFAVGDSIHISLVVSNTGTITLSGTATIQVRDGQGEVIREFGHDIPALEPGHAIPLEDTWDTSAAAKGAYVISAYALYGSMVTDPAVAVVSTELLGLRIYLPIIARNRP